MGEVTTQQISQMLDALVKASQQIAQLSDRLQYLERQIGLPEKTWFTAAETAPALNTSEQNLAIWRDTEEWEDGSLAWIEGVHYQRLPVARPTRSPKVRRSTAQYCYNVKLLMHWFNCRGDVRAQEKAASQWKREQARLAG